ncbi:uncharacterized protein, partial [Patagioenas fasciata]|uniref:uncharacterized protein n=1 Tax=Patagioenas fasciata TaxID=372321 RepID=UPI003A98E777
MSVCPRSVRPSQVRPSVPGPSVHPMSVCPPRSVRMSDRRLRPWLLAQVSSGRFPGLQWDDPERRALRIPWNRAGKGGAGGGAAEALCRAWAEFKGRVRPGAPPDPSGWKCRLRCALHRSPDFQELRGRGRHDGPRPYRVYRLLPAPPRTRPPRRKGAGPRDEPGEEEGEEPGEETPPPSAEQEAEPEPRDPGLAPPSPRLQLVIDSAEPLPPPEGGAALVLRLFLGGALSWSCRLPPGEFLLLGPPGPAPGHAPRPGHAPLPPPLPRLLLQPLPPPLREALGGGVLLGSAPRGLFLRRRGGRWGEGGRGGEVGQ